MARQASSGRLPAQLTAAQRDEIARCHEREDALVIAFRLGLSAGRVKLEVKRLRRETPSSRLPADELGVARPKTGSGAAVVAKTLLPLVLGGSFLGFAVQQRRASDHAAAAVVATTEQSPSRADETKRLYKEIDTGTVDRAHVEHALSDVDPELRLAGIRAYTRFPPASRDPGPLVEQLNFEPERLRLAALQGIGILGDARAVPALAAVAQSPRSPAERGMALDSLSRIADDSAVYPLIAALADSVGSIRLRAYGFVTKRLNTTLNTTPERLEKEPEVVRDVFKSYWKELGQ